MKNKFNAKKIVIDGITFDSIKEGVYYSTLLSLKMAKNENERIIDVKIQPRFDIIVNSVKIGFYKADFEITYANHQKVIIDVKGLKKGASYQLFRLKKKLVEAIYNIKIIEV